MKQTLREAVARRSRAAEDRIDPAGPTVHELRLKVVNRPGVLVGVTQVLAAVQVNIETLTLRLDHHARDRGDVVLTFVSDARTCDLICRKLGRLLDVISLEALASGRCQPAG